MASALLLDTEAAGYVRPSQFAAGCSEVSLVLHSDMHGLTLDFQAHSPPARQHSLQRTTATTRLRPLLQCQGRPRCFSLDDFLLIAEAPVNQCSVLTAAGSFYMQVPHLSSLLVDLTSLGAHLRERRLELVLGKAPSSLALLEHRREYGRSAAVRIDPSAAGFTSAITLEQSHAEEAVVRGESGFAVHVTVSKPLTAAGVRLALGGFITPHLHEGAARLYLQPVLLDIGELGEPGNKKARLE